MKYTVEMDERKNDKAKVNMPPCPKMCQSPKCAAYKPTPKVPPYTPIICVLGGPGAGKTTQCELLAQKYGFKHILIGNLLRDEIALQSSRSKLIEEIMAKEGLVPTDIVLDLLKDVMLKANSMGYLLERYPLEISQMVAFERDIVPISVILYFEASPATLINRQLHIINSKIRKEEVIERTVKRRFSEFYDRELYDVLKNKPKLHKIDAEAPVEVVFQEVVKILEPILKNLEIAAERKRMLYK